MVFVSSVKHGIEAQDDAVSNQKLSPKQLIQRRRVKETNKVCMATGGIEAIKSLFSVPA